MIKRLLLLCALTGTMWGQSVVRFDSNVTTTASNVPLNASAAVLTVPNAIVTVCGYPAVGNPCTNTVPVYFDQALTQPLDNPLRTDAKGRFGFWIVSGQYSYSVQNMNGVNVGNYNLTLLQGAAGNAIVAAPTVNQTITQPAGTTFTPNSQDFVLYADQCAGADIGAKINSCAALLPTASTGFKVGTIILPNTTSKPTQATWSTTVHIGPGVNLTGQGLLASAFTCTVAGDCLVHDASGSSGIFAHTVGVASVFQGFTITGNGSAGQNVVHLKDAQNLTLRDMGVDGGFGPTGSTCILLHDVNWFTERNTFDNVSTLFGCNVGWRFTTDSGNPFNPHPSFGYNRFLNIKANPNNGQTGISIEGNSFVYNCTLRVSMNADQNTGAGQSIMIHMEGGAEFFESELHMFAEGPSLYVLDIGANNQFTYIGQINVSPQVNRIAAGAIVTHWGDDGGFGPQGLHTDFFNGIRWGSSVVLASGTDLNNVNFCGDYAGPALVNAPAALGATNIRIQVVCSTNPSYVTQIAYEMEFPGLPDPGTVAPRVWQRVKNNGFWTAWREQAWMNQLPLASTTGALPGTAISAGTCSNLTTNFISTITNVAAVTATPNSTTQLISGLHWDTAYISMVGGPLLLTNASSGTSANLLVKQNTSGNVLTATTADISQILGPCVSGCGTTGTASIATTGTANIVYDGPTTSGDFVINSVTIPGAAHDFGPSPVGAPGQTIGQVLSTNGSGGTYSTQLQTGALSTATAIVPVCNTTSSSITPNITPTFNVRLIP